MKLISTAPGRAGIIGNPTDMYGGCVISCSLPRRATVTVEPDTELRLIAGDVSRTLRTEQDLEFCSDHFDIARAVFRYLGLPKEPLRIVYDSTIPMNSGLAGSTALLTALLHGLLTVQGKRLNPYQLAETVRFIEFNYLKIVCGFQDAYMSVFGGLHFMDFGGKNFSEKETGQIYATMESLDDHVSHGVLPFVLATTGVKRVSGAVHKPLGQRWQEGETAVVDGYRRITHLGRLGKRALLSGDWPTLGELMNENHAIQRDLGGSGEPNERLITAALAAGAPGAKLAGAGKGGTIIVLWPRQEVRPLELALQQAGAAAFYRPVIERGAEVQEEA